MKTDYYGLSTQSLQNSWLRLDYLTEYGPRLVRLFLNGVEENLLAETPEAYWDTPDGPYYLRGGHRLWHAPEGQPHCDIPDEGGLQIQEMPAGVRLSQPPVPQTGLAKTMDIQLLPNRPAVSITHTITNHGVWPVEMAPWAITQLPLGGLAILPQRRVGDSSGKLPDRLIISWPYSRYDDDRLEIREDYLIVHGLLHNSPFKIGTLNRHGWAAYLRNGVLFYKRFQPDLEKAYPDMGCNTEVYLDHRFLELETLAPLQRLQPGESATHVENWEIYSAKEIAAILGDNFEKIFPSK